MTAIFLALSLAALAQDPAPVAAGPAPVERNADLKISLSTVDGKTKSGHVIRIERGKDISGEKGWLSDEKSLKFYVESAKEYKKITWAEVKSITVKVLDAKDISCLYSSDFTPWMYECSVKLSAQLTTKDGKRYTVDTGHKWRFYFEDGSESEFWLKRHYANQQDERQVQLGDDTENRALYQSLQNQLRTDLKGSLIKTIRVQ
jgi:hypothetical protein